MYDRMLRGNGEPEYRRRIREKTEEDEHKTETERQKSANITKNYEVIRSIYAIHQEYQRYNNEERSRKQGDRFWEIAGVAGLWIAAAVGIAAILVGSHDASEQRGVTQRQLSEMRRAGNVMQQTLVMSQRPWLYIEGISANIDASGNDNTVVGFQMSVKNDGNAIAKNIEINGVIRSIFQLPGRADPSDIKVPCGAVKDTHSLDNKIAAAIPPKQTKSFVALDT
jgi:hypothetical protein